MCFCMFSYLGNPMPYSVLSWNVKKLLKMYIHCKNLAFSIFLNNSSWWQWEKNWNQKYFIEPILARNIKYTMYSCSKLKKSLEECPSAQNAHATDMAFILSRSSQKPMPSWTLLNQNASTVNPEKTTVGYLPIIQSLASELDTLNTIIKRVLRVAKSMEQQHVVLTVDEALYPKLLDLKWSVEEYKDMLIPCLGGLHIAMNFLDVIGRHMSESGLSELWIGYVIFWEAMLRTISWQERDMHVPSGPTHLPYRLFGNYSSHSSIRTWMGLILHWEPNSQRSAHPLTPITLHRWSTNWLPVSCSSCSWKPECWILVELYDYDQHPTLLHTSATWWIMGSLLICFQAYATIPLQVQPC